MDYIKLVKLLSPVISDLTDKEVEVTAHFLELYDTYSRSGLYVDVFSANYKRVVASIMNIQNPNDLNNYIMRLKKKNIIVLNDQSYVFNKLFLSVRDTVEFKLLWNNKK